MVLFLVTQIKLGKLTLENIRDSAILSKYYASINAELQNGGDNED